MRTARADSTEAMVLEAALICVARVGVAKTTLEDVARTAGCSRATLYRYFESKDALLLAAVRREVELVRPALAEAVAGASSLADALTSLLVGAAECFERHEALQFLLAHEPEAILPHLAFDGCGRLLAAGRDIVVEVLGDHLGGVDRDRFGEWVTRIAMSYLLSPPEQFRLSDRACARSIAEQFLVPAITYTSTEPVPEVL